MLKAGSMGATVMVRQLIWEPYWLLWSHRELLFQVVKTTLLQRNAGSLFGVLWLLAAPLLLLATYLYMFVVVLGVRPPNLTAAQYMVHMSAGLVLFLTMSQALTTATGSLAQEPGLLFNQVFPAELFPVRDVLAACPLLIVGTVAALVWGAASGTLGWPWFYAPPILVLLLMTMAGCGWILSLANLVIRDTPQLLAYALTVLMLTSPIGFEASMMPREARLIIDLNPFAYYVGALQQIVVRGLAPSQSQQLVVLVTGLVVFHGAYAMFMKGKGIIAENI